MKVKDRYSVLSEPLMYEWSQMNPSPYNVTKVTAYTFFQSVKERDHKELNFTEVLRLSKIEEAQMRELRRRK